MSSNNDYIPPKVWKWEKPRAGEEWRYSGINRPIAGPTHDAELPVGKHPLQLYSRGTPNGVKVTVMLEELLALGYSGAEYDAWLIDIGKGEQFGSGFVDVNPNSKIPALMDRSGAKPRRVFESGSILLYLAEKFGAFLPSDPDKRTEVLNWLFWQMGSTPYIGAVFSRLGTATWITHQLLAIPLPATATIALLFVLIFLLGWPFEWPAIVLIFLPVLAPVAAGLGYDMIYFGTVTAVVLQTAFLSPPVAMSAYYLKQVVKEWKIGDIYKGMYQFMVLQVLCVGILLYYPQIVTWLPSVLQEQARAEKIPEEHRKIIEKMRKETRSLEDDEWGKK